MGNFNGLCDARQDVVGDTRKRIEPLAGGVQPYAGGLPDQVHQLLPQSEPGLPSDKCNVDHTGLFSGSG